MRRLIRLAVSLYPPQWRRRYAREFEALLDEVGFSWRAFFNILLGALIMQMNSPRRMPIVLMLTAALVGALASRSIPAQPNTSETRVDTIGRALEPARVQHAQSPERTSVNQTTWQRFETAHFSLVSTPEHASRISTIGSLAERVYQQVRSDLLHDLSAKPLLVLVNAPGDLEQPFASRLVLPGDRHGILLWIDDPSLPGTLAHEVTHAFILDIIPRSGRTELPIWIHEGLADHERGDWREPDLALLRDLVQANAVPAMTAAFSGDRRLHRILGHATFDFIVTRVGKDGLRRFLAALRDDQTSNLVGVYRTAFGPAFDDFNRDFAQYLRTRFPEQPRA